MSLNVNGPNADAMTVASAKLLHFLFASFLLLDNAFAFTTFTSVQRRASIAKQFATRNHENASARRQLLSWGLSSCSFLSLPSSAFENKISGTYDDRPKRPGPQPKDLGVAMRKDMIGDEYIGLKPCGPAPNCFCSTDDIEDDPEHNIPSWTWPKDMNMAQAFEQLQQVIKAYKPGQGNIDGGGFKIIKSEPGYLYVQFESLKNGYIDDAEFAYIKDKGDNTVQVRSSSRVGYLDYGVNAKRLNYIAHDLRAEGWNAPGVDFSVHQDYAIQNNVQ